MALSIRELLERLNQIDESLISDEDSEWLQSLEGARLSDAQAKALVVARRRGAVSNVELRSISGLYILGARARPPSSAGGTSADRGGLGADRGGLEADRGGLEADRGELPEDVRSMLAALGPRPRQEKLRPVIERLCSLYPWRPAELARVLGLTDAEKLVERHLGPMCDAGVLTRTYPETPSHPEQAYRAVPRELPE